MAFYVRAFDVTRGLGSLAVVREFARYRLLACAVSGPGTGTK